MNHLRTLSCKRRIALFFCAILSCVALAIGALLPNLAYAEDPTDPGTGEEPAVTQVDVKLKDGFAFFENMTNEQLRNVLDIRIKRSIRW